MNIDKESVWRLLPHSNYPDLRHAVVRSPTGFNMDHFMKCRPWIGSLPDDFRIVVKPGRGAIADYLNTPVGGTIVSRSWLNAVMELIGEDVQIIPAPVITHEGESVEGYCIVNELKKCDCVDVTKSHVFSMPSSHMRVYDVAVLSKKLCRGLNLFRAQNPDGSATDEVFVSASMVQALSGKGLTGFCFIPADN